DSAGSIACQSLEQDATDDGVALTANIVGPRHRGTRCENGVLCHRRERRACWQDVGQDRFGLNDAPENLVIGFAATRRFDRHSRAPLQIPFPARLTLWSSIAPPLHAQENGGS